MIDRPKVLLLGNGLLQAFGGESWNDFLNSIKRRDDLDNDLSKIICPEPLKAILVTGDKVDVAMRAKCEKLLSNNDFSEDLSDMLRLILSMGFDHILTTNYTYEIEQAAIYPESLSESKLKKMSKSTAGRVEGKYLIHTYSRVVFEDRENKVWHIHGEARKPDSTILGHYYYGNLLCKIREEVKKIDECRWERMAEKNASWIDAFLFGDIYCIGFGFGFSEFDLWWLLNRKAREKNNYGKMYFYEPFDIKYWAKIDLLNLMKNSNGEHIVEVINQGYKTNSEINWRQYYKDVIEDISRKLNAEEGNMIEMSKDLAMIV